MVFLSDASTGSIVQSTRLSFALAVGLYRSAVWYFHDILRMSVVTFILTADAGTPFGASVTVTRALPPLKRRKKVGLFHGSTVDVIHNAHSGTVARSESVSVPSIEFAVSGHGTKLQW